MHFTSALRRLVAIAACITPLAAQAAQAAPAPQVSMVAVSDSVGSGNAAPWMRSSNDSGGPGDSADQPGRLERAFIYSGGIVIDLGQHGTMIDLNALTDPAFGTPLIQTSTAPGQQPVTGSACMVNAGCRAVRLEPLAPLVPIPEPSTYVMLLAGLALLGWGARSQDTPLFVR